jgi:hypothetical protein
MDTFPQPGDPSEFLVRNEGFLLLRSSSAKYLGIIVIYIIVINLDNVHFVR